jgi:hypothetical protein
MTLVLIFVVFVLNSTRTARYRYSLTTGDTIVKLPESFALSSAAFLQYFNTELLGVLNRFPALMPKLKNAAELNEIQQRNDCGFLAQKTAVLPGPSRDSGLGRSTIYSLHRKVGWRVGSPLMRP